jgi:hypothetical protein
MTGFVKEIAPTKGLGQQEYKCADCEAIVGFESMFPEARHCDYSGRVCDAHCLLVWLSHFRLFGFPHTKKTKNQKTPPPA